MGVSARVEGEAPLLREGAAVTLLSCQPLVPAVNAQVVGGVAQHAVVVVPLPFLQTRVKRHGQRHTKRLLLSN